MSNCKAIDPILLPALLLISLGVVPRASMAQPSHQVQTPLATTSPAPSSPSQQVTPEELGDSMVAHKRYQEAIAEYAKAPQMSAAMWNKMGIAYQMMLNAKDATRCYRESLKLDPGNSQVLNNLGTVYASLREYGQADRMYHKALKIDPRSAIILKNLGTNLLAEHKYNKGWEAYQRAIAIDPQVFAGHTGPAIEDPSNVKERGAMNYYMAAGCASAGYTDCALEYLRRALDEGFVTRKKIASDSEFASLRSNPAFQQLIAEQRNQ